MSVTTEVLNQKADPAAASLYTVVKIKDDVGETSKEVADVISVSGSGAGFCLKRPCEVGRLVLLMLPLPSQLRSYDHDKELYRVWGLVQHCHKTSAGGNSYQVGVAFVGKSCPPSYDENPLTSYRIIGMDETGLWKVTETGTAFKKRQHMRYWTPVELYLTLVDGNREAVVGERTVTENISRSGAAVITTLDVNVGDRVKFISEKYDFSGLAVVCNRQEGSDKRTRLHLRFVESTFPVNRLNVSAVNIRE